MASNPKIMKIVADDQVKLKQDEKDSESLTKVFVPEPRRKCADKKYEKPLAPSDKEPEVTGKKRHLELLPWQQFSMGSFRKQFEEKVPIEEVPTPGSACPLNDLPKESKKEALIEERATLGSACLLDGLSKEPEEKLSIKEEPNLGSACPKDDPLKQPEEKLPIEEKPTLGSACTLDNLPKEPEEKLSIKENNIPKEPKKKAPIEEKPTLGSAQEKIPIK